MNGTARVVVAATAALLLAPAAMVGAVAAGLSKLPEAATPSALATADIPADLLADYQQAAARCPGLSWPVLAGIGKVASDHNRPPGQVSPAGGRGPMQFRPATWAVYRTDANADGRADPFDPADAIGTAADDLCTHGAARDTATALADFRCDQDAQPVADCRRSAEEPGGYVPAVLDWASRYTEPLSASGPVATVAVQVALGQVGTPYVWGGETPGVGFDCSGLVVFAFRAAGVALPRTAQTQYDAGPLLPAGTDPAIGDLIFFGAGPRQVSHVGISLGQGRMVDAPHTGALVRVEPVRGFGHYLGATRPATPAAAAATHPAAVLS
ncbi:MAG: NlpC/P60 family protein [Mycobacteriales bacterium]